MPLCLEGEWVTLALTTQPMALCKRLVSGFEKEIWRVQPLEQRLDLIESLLGRAVGWIPKVFPTSAKKCRNCQTLL